MNKPGKSRPRLGGIMGENYNSALSQCVRILTWFIETSPRLSTIDSRERLAIMSLAPRIMELRRQGHQIDSEWIFQKDVTGTSHRNKVYIYMGKEVCDIDTALTEQLKNCTFTQETPKHVSEYMPSVMTMLMNEKNKEDKNV